MKKEDALNVIKELDNIKASRDYDESRQKAEKLCENYIRGYPHFIKSFKSKIEKYLCFLKYPEEIRKYIYTTNSVESFPKQDRTNKDEKWRIFSIC